MPSTKKPRVSATADKAERRKQALAGAQNSAKKRSRGRGRPFGSKNPYAFKATAENGGVRDPRINPGGRPKRLGEAYAALLARVNEDDPQQRTNAEMIALAMSIEARRGNVAAAKEIRSATEGDRLSIDFGKLDDNELDRVIAELEGKLRAGADGESEPPAVAAGGAGLDTGPGQ